MYNVQIAPYESSQLEKLFALFGTYFEPEDRLMRREYLEWLYGANPFGKAMMVCVSHGERWVAFMALIPVTFRRAAERMPAHYAVNALVDPAHQGKHLFARMISAARESIGVRHGALVGHPNAQALKTWQRARVHFQEVLRPMMAVPLIHARGFKARLVHDAGDLAGVTEALCRRAASRDYWKVDLSQEYMRWRYFDQPSAGYKTQVVLHEGEQIGFQVAKPMRHGLNLLIDQWIPDAYLRAATTLLPTLTVCCIPASAKRELPRTFVPLPARKILPYFFTCEPRVDGADVRHLNLSASDF
ncbi:GNAT family N-acetyltransferase [Ramlibacter sp. AN1133]|uniref:GNAT family N-acetyltransferase n=1 Tax=Ramlibacter sp. AN1133 TaxID=3133429 RepID=UPI0030BD253D